MYVSQMIFYGHVPNQNVISISDLSHVCYLPHLIYVINLIGFDEEVKFKNYYSK
jgi:hypothetical protein